MAKSLEEWCLCLLAPWLRREKLHDFIIAVRALISPSAKTANCDSHYFHL